MAEPPLASRAHKSPVLFASIALVRRSAIELLRWWSRLKMAQLLEVKTTTMRMKTKQSTLRLSMTWLKVAPSLKRSQLMAVASAEGQAVE